jgi:hypothetical protein
MYNCINEAFEYLKNKYGCIRFHPTAKHSNRLARANNKKEREEIRESLTDREYNLRLNPITEEKDKVIELLMNQYYYGIDAKRELYYTLIKYGVLNAA